MEMSESAIILALNKIRWVKNKISLDYPKAIQPNPGLLEKEGDKKHIERRERGKGRRDQEIQETQ